MWMGYCVGGLSHGWVTEWVELLFWLVCFSLSQRQSLVLVGPCVGSRSHYWDNMILKNPSLLIKRCGHVAKRMFLHLAVAALDQWLPGAETCMGTAPPLSLACWFYRNQIRGVMSR